MANINKVLRIFVMVFLASITQTAFCADIIMNNYTTSSRPSATAGRIIRVTDSVFGMQMGDGTTWRNITDMNINTGRHISNFTNVFDLNSSTYGNNARSSGYEFPETTYNLNSQEINLIRGNGTMTGQGILTGFYTNITTSGLLGSRARGFIANVATQGSGEAKAIHAHAIAGVNATSNAIITGIIAQTTIESSATPALSRGLQISQTVGPVNITDAIFLDSQGSGFRRGLALDGGTYSDAAIYMGTGANNLGKIKWSAGEYIQSVQAGQIEISGTLRHSFNSASGTNNLVQAIDISRESSGTVENGFGSLVQLKLENANGTTGVLAADFGAKWLNASAGSETSEFILRTSVWGAVAERIRISDGLQVGAPTGGDKGYGTINVSGDIYRNGTAYTNPDYVFNHFVEGANDKGYKGPLNFDELRIYIQEERHLPGISREASGIFERSDMLLEKLEEAYLYILELEERMSKLEKEG